MKKHYRQENDCLNCGTILKGKYCHNCGQENLEIKESFGHMMNHAISDYFHFDHQFFHTLKPLLFKPGFLTNEYMAGRRAQYLHPVKMYIFISIVYFLLLFKTGHDTEIVKVNATPGNPAHSGKVVDSVSKAIINNHNISAADKKKLLEKIKKEDAKGVQPIDTVNENFKSGLLTLTPDSSYNQYMLRQQALPAEQRDGWIERMINKKAFSYKSKYGNRSKEVFFDEVRHNIPKMMFLLLPLFALILKISFWRNKKFYVEHLIFAFHLHCFLFIFLAFIMLLNLILPESKTIADCIGLAATLYIIWYIYRSLKVVYHRSVFRTITKFIGIYVSYMVVFIACMMIVLFVTALTL
ncbi:DUF3667 domain-containing protein [Mucilaginibacter sp. L3T2-6]|uniref:DUF3667 domain-containing protein n=1 Tax=Mucilaginibacter sp. L3T2-6 TaxID=3062491 RepID=UPI002676156E|nr:DUF3667 domain-containing protein [Mucilaginibacter sp. L3T2-6]MDO3644980.1 DUF3667 domain-containing protein [Mucilaginibacter sp. L3T2-6]MDV6217394.1 DUF3667 domain-containing protein [Mucilaginibacter sp. L3T2-6]